MKIKKHNIFLLLFVISYVAVLPFVFIELYNNSGVGRLLAAHFEDETSDLLGVIDEPESNQDDIIETPPMTNGEEPTTSTGDTSVDVSKDSEITSEQETSPDESQGETTEGLPTETAPEETEVTSSETETTQGETETTQSGETTSETETSAEPEKELQFTTVDPSYFNDALFIGDSRTVGIYEYGVLNGADFFCNIGMSVYSVHKAEVSVASVGKTTFTKLLESQTYGKIYIMLGINELGYSFSKNVKRYGELISEIQRMQPNAIIYVQANLHVAKKRSESDAVYNNYAINRFNQAISEHADNKNIFYIDVNTLFDDEEGNLNKIYTGDNTHPYARYYTKWSEWLCDMAIVK